MTPRTAGNNSPKTDELFELLDQEGYRVINLTDGLLLSAAVEVVENKAADGINLNFIRNFPETIDAIKASKRILSLSVNDYDHNRVYDYTAIHHLQSLKQLSVYTTDKKEIDYSAFPLLESTAIMWRPKAKSLFHKHSLRRLFLGRYGERDLSALSTLTKLEYLRLNTGSITSLKGIAALTDLRQLMLMRLTKLEDIEEISNLANLQYVRIDNCKRVGNIDLVKKMRIPRLEIAGTTPI